MAEAFCLGFIIGGMFAIVVTIIASPKDKID